MTDQPAQAGLAEAKRQLRTRMQAQRRRLVSPAAGPRLVEVFAALEPIEPGLAVSGFWPIGEEIDVKPLMTALDRRGHPIGLPVVTAKGEPLLFRRWSPGDSLVPAAFGLSVPGPQAETIVPRLLLVPLLAFDRAGYRLGYGGGFYDRTLARLRAAGPVTAVGVGYAGQEVEAVPHGPGDERLDWIMSERWAIRIETR